MTMMLSSSEGLENLTSESHPARSPAAQKPYGDSELFYFRYQIPRPRVPSLPRPMPRPESTGIHRIALIAIQANCRLPATECATPASLRN